MKYVPDAEYLMWAAIRGLHIAGERIRHAYQTDNRAAMDIWWREGIQHHADAVSWASKNESNSPAEYPR